MWPVVLLRLGRGRAAGLPLITAVFSLYRLLVTECGRVFCFGWGADGQLGGGAFDSRWQPRPALGDLDGERIVKVACLGRLRAGSERWVASMAV